ncbi:MAG: DUF1624 domain-containing protein [Ruminococcaceae bacterium]|nr:DUF1624 domain-containing protein [Oscillospiraceae bacterium]
MNNNEITKKKRIWELDFIRGVAIIGVVFVHVVYDLNSIFRVNFDLGPVFDVIQEYGSLIFIVLSGICVTLGRHNIKRGLIVLGGGAIISGVTYFMVHMGMLSSYAKIDFGILSCLGCCMLFYSLVKDVNKYVLLAIGAVFIGLGFWTSRVYLDYDWLLALGLRSRSYYAGDYFPLLPNLGYFLWGSFIGKTAYKNKKTLIPAVNDQNIVIKAFSFLGRQSLWIYLAHQPIAYGVLYLIFEVIK